MPLVKPTKKTPPPKNFHPTVLYQLALTVSATKRRLSASRTNAQPPQILEAPSQKVPFGSTSFYNKMKIRGLTDNQAVHRQLMK